MLKRWEKRATWERRHLDRPITITTDTWQFKAIEGIRRAMNQIRSGTHLHRSICIIDSCKMKIINDLNLRAIIDEIEQSWMGIGKNLVQCTLDTFAPGKSSGEAAPHSPLPNFSVVAIAFTVHRPALAYTHTRSGLLPDMTAPLPLFSCLLTATFLLSFPVLSLAGGNYSTLYPSPSISLCMGPTFSSLFFLFDLLKG